MSRILMYLSHGFLPMEAMYQGVTTVTTLPVTRRAISVYGTNDYESCCTCVVFGGKPPTDRILADQRQHDTPVLVVDLGYIKRGNIPQARQTPDAIYWSINKNGLNGWGDPPRSPMPADRWERLDTPLAPWQSAGTHILVCGQKPHDAAIDGVNPLAWAQDTIAQLVTLTDRPLRWRPHPEDLTSRRHTISGAVQSAPEVSIAEDLQDAYAVVAFNSNALVDGLLAGIPIYILGAGSVCIGMGHTTLSEETLASPLRPDRTQFFADLAYRQWTIPEMEQGLPWAHFFGDVPDAAPAPRKKRGRRRKTSSPVAPLPVVAPPAPASTTAAPDDFISPEALLKTIHS